MIEEPKPPIELAAERITDHLRMPFSLGDALVSCPCSIGVSYLPGDARNAEELLAHARDIARRARVRADELADDGADDGEHEHVDRHVGRERCGAQASLLVGEDRSGEAGDDGERRPEVVRGHRHRGQPATGRRGIDGNRGQGRKERGQKIPDALLQRLADEASEEMKTSLAALAELDADLLQAQVAGGGPPPGRERRSAASRPSGRQR